MVRCFILLLAAVVFCEASRPVGFYTFDGKALRPMPFAQRRSDNEDGWKLPFAKPAFLSALTKRDDDDAPTISSAQLLPDYLTHQEFLKPQLQAAGFSGGRIIAGPFPVPLASLQKSALRSVPPKHSKAQIALPKPAPLYKPVQFPAVPAQRPKLVYNIPTAVPAHWHTAHQSGPEKPVSTLGVATFSHPAAVGDSSKLSYGGWTPIYSPSYAHVQHEEPVPEAEQSLDDDVAALTDEQAAPKRTVRKRKAKQVRPVQEITSGRVQGRYVGRVLPASIFDNWRQMNTPVVTYSVADLNFAR